MTEDSGWLELTPSQTNGVNNYSGTIYYRKHGLLLIISGYDIKLSNQIAANDYRELGRLPSGSRPSKELVASCHLNTIDVDTKIVPLRVATSGYIYIYSNNQICPANKSIRFSVMGFL